MKRIFKFYLLLFVSSALIVSCDEGTDILNLGPEMTVFVTPQDNAGVISGGSGEEIEFDVSVTADEGFNVFRVKEIVDGTETTLWQRSRVSGTTVTTFDTVFTFTLSPEYIDKNVQLELEAVDDTGGTTTEPFTIEVTSSVTTFTAVLLGGPGNTQEGSFYNAISNEVYLASEAFSKAGQVDFLYFFGNTSQNSIAATDDSDAETAFNAQAGINLTAMTTQNPTRFKPLVDVTVAEFDAIAGTSELFNTFGQDIAANESKVTDLAVDDVFGFTLAQDRDNITGIAKVTQIVSTSPQDRSITLEIKLAL